ncbi:putative envelope protein ODV-E66-2, partial [Microplitis demolitor]
MTLSNHQEIFNEYQTESYLKTFNKHFMKGDVPKVGKIASFGIAVLAKYATDDHLKEYLHVAEDLIRKVEDKLGAIKIGSDKKVPWGCDWFDFSVLLTRMLAMYEYLGEDKEVKTICGRRIIEIIPELNKSLGWTRNGFEFVYIAIPRMMTNYLNDRELYDSEARDQKNLFESLSRIFNITYNTEDDGKDGLYRDGSYLYRSVATYSYLASLGNFYGTVYRALGFETNIDGKVTELLDKIQHPDMDFVPYGLFGREPKITCNDILKYYWPKYRKKAKLGVIIFPYIGLGVFKSPKFVFSLRVQREDIAAYESDP